MGFVIGLLIGLALGWVGHLYFGPAVQTSMRRNRSSSVAAPATPPIHTVKGDEGWEVTQEGRAKPIESFDTKAEAQAAGRELAKEVGTDHVVHKVDGSVGDLKHYGESNETAAP